jgi:tetratricopeptide (TPR) repeat protein
MKNKNWIIRFKSNRGILLILAIAFAVFLISLRNGFVWDDWKLLVYNEAYQTLDLKRIFLTKANGLEYLPFRDLTLSIDVQLCGMEPLGFHLTNLFLYLVGLIIVFKTVKILANLAGEKEKAEFIAFWTTLIFALHPLHAETVNFIAARNNLIAALFMFLSFNLCIEGIQKKKNSLIFLSTLLFIISLFSKASVIFYPFFLAVVFFLVPNTMLSVRKKVLILLVFLLIDVSAVWIHYKNACETGMMNEGFIRYGSTNKAFLLARALQIPFFYLKMLILPYPLSVLYPVSFVSGEFVVRTVLAGVAIATIFSMVWLWRKRHPLFILGVAWYFLSLGPVLNIFPTEPVVADRYAYLAVLGFGLLSAYLLKIVTVKRRGFLYAACGIMILWSFIDFSRNRVWNNDLSLWESALSVNPDMPRVELANALWAKGRYEEALAHLKEEHNKSGTFRYSQFLGKYLSQSGRYEDAILLFKKALAEGGDASKEVHLELARAYEKAGFEMPALEHYLKAIEIKDANPIGRIDKMAKEGTDRVRARFMPKLNELRFRAFNEPMNFEAQSSLALFLHTLGMYNEAEAFYLNSLRLNPSSWVAWYNLGLTYMKRQQYAEAIKSFEKSLFINPQNKDALNNIGICYMAMRDYRQAAKYYTQALETDPNFFYAAFNLGRVYFITGDGEKSREYFSMAKVLAKGNADSLAMIEQYLQQMR